MAEEPITRSTLVSTLTQFHRDVMVPDIERIVERSEQRLRDEMLWLHRH